MTAIPLRFILFPGLPNELGLAIISELSFFDLLIVRHVSPLWKRTIDNNSVMREELFRLPKKVNNANAATRKAFVDDLWTDLHKKVDGNAPLTELWNHIKLNPLFISFRGGVVARGSRSINPLVVLSPPRLPHLTNAQHEETDAIFASMFITYPPVPRLQLFLRYSMRTRTAIHGPSVEMINRGGLTCMELSDRVSTREYVRYALLWPESAWLG